MSAHDDEIESAKDFAEALGATADDMGVMWLKDVVPMIEQRDARIDARGRREALREVADKLDVTAQDEIESAEALYYRIGDEPIADAVRMIEQRDAQMEARGAARGRREALESITRLQAIVDHYAGPHVEDDGVCITCSLDESLQDEDADWPCWVTRALAATEPPAAHDGGE